VCGSCIEMVFFVSEVDVFLYDYGEDKYPDSR